MYKYLYATMTTKKIDTAVRHVTKPDANVFLELGFPPAEARRLHAASRKQINETQRLMRQSPNERAMRVSTRRGSFNS